VILEDELVSLKMIDVEQVIKLEDGYLLDTGSMHFVIFKEDIPGINVVELGRKIRYQERFGDAGTNVNFAELTGPGKLSNRTYERGVENETLACGTGAVATAISSYILQKADKTTYTIETRGGILKVSFKTPGDGTFKDIWLEGPVKYVFKGEIQI
jgi:diaminopimelate epimerase